MGCLGTTMIDTVRLQHCVMLGRERRGKGELGIGCMYRAFGGLEVACRQGVVHGFSGGDVFG